MKLRKVDKIRFNAWFCLQHNNISTTHEYISKHCANKKQHALAQRNEKVG